MARLARTLFYEHFGFQCQGLAAAPGRVNLIGEHTDYNDGLVLPVALDLEVQIAFSPRKDRTWMVYSDEYQQSVEINLDALGERGGGAWDRYLAALAWALGEAHYAAPGATLFIHSDLPQAAGLSSSAALEMALARAACALGGWDWKPSDMALLAHRAENDYVGVSCGIMDPFAVALGAPGSALFLDCRDRSYRQVPVRFTDHAFVVADSGLKRELRLSAYNQRRAECVQAVDALKRLDSTVSSLRDVGQNLLDRASQSGPAGSVWLKRARHVVSENRRVQQAVQALETGDAQVCGALMNASHLSLRQDYEVTGPHLDALAELAQCDPACAGSRMTGAGFGGCTISLVRKDALAVFCATLQDGYFKRTGRLARTFAFQPGRPARLLD